MSEVNPLRSAQDGLRLPRWAWVALAAVLVLAFTVRLWMSWPNPGPKRYWDERYLAANTAAVLTDGWSATRNVYYPGLGHLPTALLLSGAEALGLVDNALHHDRRNPQLDDAGYRVARTVTALWGVAGLWFLFLLGRELGSWRLGLAAATVLSVVPWHLRQSAIYKPDIALCTLVTATLWACLRLRRCGGFVNWLLLWGLAALAVSAKWNAAPLLIPIAIVSVVRWRVDGPQVLRRCLAAMALGTVLLLALNPTLLLQPSAYVSDLSKTAQHYEGRAEKAEASHLDMPVHAVQSLLSEGFLGWGVGAGALLGWVLATASIVRRRRGEVKSLLEISTSPWSVVLSWVLSYVVIYTVLTSYPSPHNWLPLLPMAALGASWLCLCLVRLGAQRAAPLGVALALGFAALLGERALATWELAVAEAIPTTRQVAEELLRQELGDLDGRVVRSDTPLDSRLWSFAVQGRVLDPTGSRVLVLSLASADRSVTDATVRTLPGSDRPCSGKRISAGWFRARGDTLCVENHAMLRAHQPQAVFLDFDGRSAPVPLEAPPPGSNDPWLSLDLNLLLRPDFELEPDGSSGVYVEGRAENAFEAPGSHVVQDLTCHTVVYRRNRLQCRTPRFRWHPGDELFVRTPVAPQRGSVQMWWWTEAE